MKEIKAIIFDLDGVITDTAEYHYLAWKQLADDLGIPFDRIFNERLKGVSRMDSLQMILDHGGIVLAEEEIEALAHKKNEHYKTFIGKITPDDLLPGILPFLTQVRAAGIPTALASASKNARPVIRQLRIESYLDTVVDAASVERGKPDPEIFLKAAQQLNVNPEQCVGIEDAEAGVKSIKTAGMFAVGVGTKTAMAEADWIIDHPSQLTLEALKSHYK
ncbi:MULTISPECIES: beta-phosphoglucomutase [Pontibacillus]|uniref:Beta-phosphoglucomutase n=1 Tax=Pontibacillus chungwhensis TaxID=265426 RepID=A0ABY8UXA6_9BACI|nr:MULTISPECIES: beta-phosphoglucomutase [Pontibacillus]MCD5325998.1 beta-phosphoglucomutase [Pontibacillus sp. HN14]WIF98297.1 beta-phosphoglucomutase [Pontibacillus chungwhensis]